MHVDMDNGISSTVIFGDGHGHNILWDPHNYEGDYEQVRGSFSEGGYSVSALFLHLLVYQLLNLAQTE